ncbi:hypothetical protein PCNPT3_06660 [Psychromonas sp. CNPT3]|uniref:hypothetical protein n=1 Tax=Psychromonas sp. CNPT3 TaxID=314282 RepID=UPI00006E482D|nr:hypothetical protein [Psychromonas sp. CNPT3]AGH81272.1 hypothetical protein PCNPT3_06660 [Psychromonas sp. CNPT3]
MDIKKKYISDLATFLSNQGKVMSGEELAVHLNRNGFRTSYGSKYKGGRGTYKLIKSIWSTHDSAEERNEADNVANAFVKPNGGYAYK